MIQLLRSNFFCLWRNEIFWLCEVFIIAIACIFIKNEGMQGPDIMVLKGGQFLSFIIPVFISFLVGTEYSDGTIRNKIVAGHSRLSIYIAQFLVCMFASFFLLALYTLAALGVSQVQNLKFVMPVEDLFIAIVCCFVVEIAYTALFTLVGMLTGSRGECLVLSVLLFMLLFIVGSDLPDEIAINGQKYRIVSEGYQENESGKMQLTDVEVEENVNYLKGTKRKIYYFLNDLLPSCQIERLVKFPDYYTMDLEKYADYPNATVYTEKISDIQKFPLYAGLVILLTGISGCFLFCIREIK